MIDMNEFYYLLSFLLVSLVSFVFPAIGLGGGQIYTPAFHWLGMPLKGAVSLALWLSFVSTTVASINYFKARLIDLKAALPIAVPLLISAPLGATFTGIVSDRVILFVFALITTFGVAQSFVGLRPKGEYSRRTRVLISVVVGASIGFVGGMVGRGGGSIILPALLILGLKHKNAAAVSVFCVNAGVLVSFIVHATLGHIIIDIPWFLGLTLIVLAGAFTGSHLMTRRFKHKTVKYLFAIVLSVIAAKLYVESLF